MSYDGMVTHCVVSELNQKLIDGKIDKIFTTNLIYQPQELLDREWYCSVNMSKYIALLVETLNYDNSISSLLDPVDRIKKIVAKYGQDK